TWYRVAFTYESTGLKLYLDGSLVASSTSTATIGYDSHALTIGDDFNSERLGNPWSGRLAEVSLWNVALTQAQILATAQPLSGTEAGL
ncbi:LamG domain-containing protein, partial [Acinetobacter baumannii]